jgi:hypothetical protein
MANSRSKTTATTTVSQILQAARNRTTVAVGGASGPSSPSPQTTVVSTTGGSATHRRAARKAVRVRPGGYEQVDVATECGMAVPIGPAVIDLLELAYRASVPALLIGSAGLGKSEITAAAAAALGIECISRDLSLMEPPDLVGLPKINDDVTKYFPPEFLPRGAERKGFLLFEEINRAPRYMAAACLELLTSRRLNSYVLPSGFLPVACINPRAEGYHVDVLDAALASRFMKIEVRAAVGPWTEWAQRNGVHSKIIAYVNDVPNALDEARGGTNPRSWAYASRVLLAAGEETLAASPDTVVAALNGIIGPVHTTTLLRLIMGTEVALKPADVIHNWPTSRATMRRWGRQGRLDLLAASMRAVLQWLRPEGVAEQVRANTRESYAVREFFRHLPGDLTGQAHACLLEHGYTFLISAAAGSKSSKA